MSRRCYTICLVVALAACKPTTITSGNPADETPNAATPVTLPPPIRESKVYRCKDNSLVSIDFLADDRTANLKVTKEGPIITLTSPERGQPFIGSGYEVNGSGASITLQRPGKDRQTCRS